MSGLNEKELVARITGYLAGGGLFNPEMANHDAVRDLLIDCRDTLASSPLAGDAATIERCAKVAENFDLGGLLDGERLPKGWQGCRRSIAAAIRKLHVEPPHG